MPRRLRCDEKERIYNCSLALETIKCPLCSDQCFLKNMYCILKAKRLIFQRKVTLCFYPDLSFCSVVITGMDEDDIKHIRDSTIITEFNLNEEGEVKDF
jgi:hypothetical protein